MMRLALLLMLVFGVALVGCKKDNPAPVNPEKKFSPYLFVLNEGNFGLTNSILSFIEFGDKGRVVVDYVKEVGGVEEPLGGTGNDIEVVGGKIFCAMNGSHSIVVIGRKDGKRLGEVKELNNVRQLASKDGFVYATAWNGDWSYVGPGKVYKIDANSLSIVKEVEVSAKAEGIAIQGDRVYVSLTSKAGTAVEILSASDLSLVEKVNVGKNGGSIAVGADGSFWLQCQAIFDSNWNVTEAATLRRYVKEGDSWVEKVNEEKSVGRFTTNGDTLFTVVGQEVHGYLKDATPVVKISVSQVSKPYGGIAKDPVSGRFAIADAKDYKSAGAVYLYEAKGTLVKEYKDLGILPAHMVFVGE